MRSLFLIAAFSLLVPFSVLAQGKASKKDQAKAVLTVDSFTVSVGKLAPKAKAEYVIKLTNTGTTNADLGTVSCNHNNVQMQVMNKVVKPGGSAYILCTVKADSVVDKTFNYAVTVTTLGTINNKYGAAATTAGKGKKVYKFNLTDKIASDGKPEHIADAIFDPKDFYTLNEESHNFGNITEGVVAEFDFVVTNISDQPLTVVKANASCGCTVPTAPKDPIAPGASAPIKVQYNSQGRPGNFAKSVFIVTNRGNKTVNINGNVGSKQSEGEHHPHDGHNHEGHNH